MKPIPIADDYAGIARRMAEIKQESHNKLGLVVPENVIIVNYGTKRYHALNALSPSALTAIELCLVLRGTDLQLLRSKLGKLVTSHGFDLFEYLRRYFPSAKINSSSMWISFSNDDTKRLALMIENQK